MSKTQQVLRALREDGKTLTALSAQKLCGTMRLASIVHALRRRGHPIVSRDRKLDDGTIISEYSYRDFTGHGHNRCVSGKHVWLDEVSRRRCCNGFVRRMRRISAPKLVGEVSGGDTPHSDPEFAGWVNVWVHESAVQPHSDHPGDAENWR